VYKYNADILPSMPISCPALDNFFSKLYNIHDHGTRRVSEKFYHKRVRTDYGKNNTAICKTCCMGCISNNNQMLPIHTVSNQVKSRMLAG